MATFEVTTCVLVHVHVKTHVDADDRDAAIEAAQEQLPDNLNNRGWSAKVTIKAPKDVTLVSCKPIAVTPTSGGERARKVAP